MDTYQSGQRKWGPVVLAHKQALQDDLVELGIGPSCQEAIQLKCNNNKVFILLYIV